MADRAVIQGRREREPIEYLKELYVVVAALSLTKTLEALLTPVDGRVDWTLLVPVTTFLVTVVPFFHGALEHLRRAHGDGPESIPLVLWDFSLLFLEACVLLLAAGSMADPTRLAVTLAALWAIDILWVGVGQALGAGRRHGPALAANDVASASGPPGSWALINTIAAPVAIAIGVWVPEPSITWALLATAFVRTVLDYWMNADFYFGRLLESDATALDTPPPGHT